MKTLAQLNAEYEAKTRELKQQIAIAETLPVGPNFVIISKGVLPSAHYKAENTKEAMLLVKQFPSRLPYADARGTYRKLMPLDMFDAEGHMPWDDTVATILKAVPEGTPFMKIHKGDGFCSVEWCFFTHTEAGTLCIEIDIGTPPHGLLPYYRQYGTGREAGPYFPTLSGGYWIRYASSGLSIYATAVWHDNKHLLDTLNNNAVYEGLGL